MRYLLLTLVLFYYIISINTVYAEAAPSAVPAGMPNQNVAMQFSICTNAANLFGMQNGSTVKLDTVKQFLQTVSTFTNFAPREAAENIMQLQSADNIVFYCTDTSTVNHFTAEIVLTYMNGKDKVQTPAISLSMVPRDQPQPQPLEIPPPPKTQQNTPAAPQPSENAPPSYSDQLK